MIYFTFTEADNRYIFLKIDYIDGKPNKDDLKIMRELMDHINLVDPICYLPTYKGRPPFTHDFLFEYTQPGGSKIWYCPIGLWQVIYIFLKEKNYPFTGLIENKDIFKQKLKHTFEEFKDIVDSWGLKYKPRPYQYECAYKILQYKQSVSQLATRAGKTLLSYIIFRYALEYLNAHKILMIVPSIQLVKQGYDDFYEYAEFFKTECLWAGGKLVASSNLTIGTFQTLIKFLDKKSKKFNPSFFEDFDIVCVDETHRATAEQIRRIITQPFMKNVKIAFGITGTLPKPKTIPYYCLHSLLGPKIQEIRPKELMDAGFISKVHIKQLRLNYKDKDKLNDITIRCLEYALSEYVFEDDPNHKNKKKKVELDNPEFLIRYKKELPYGIVVMKNSMLQGNISKEQYINTLVKTLKGNDTSNMLFVERMITHFMNERVEYLCNNILPKCDNNTLILAHHTEYINYIVEIIKKRFPNKHIDVITGRVSAKRRDQIKQMLKDNKDCILIASYGCIGTGITLSDLCYGVLFESFKSEIINMQSIGRGLGLSDMKEKYILYDMIDIYPTKKLYLQGREKVKIYEEEKYPYEIINISL